PKRVVSSERVRQDQDGPFCTALQLVKHVDIANGCEGQIIAPCSRLDLAWRRGLCESFPPTPGIAQERPTALESRRRHGRPLPDSREERRQCFCLLRYSFWRPLAGSYGPHRDQGPIQAASSPARRKSAHGFC